jgi:L-lysine 6-transaminase
MVRAAKYLEIYREEKILDYVSKVAGPALFKGLNELQAEFPDFIRNVRGKGLMCAYDICSPELRDKFLKECHANNMLILGCGGNTVRFRPALNVPLEDIEKGMDISRKAAKAVFKK